MQTIFKKFKEQFNGKSLNEILGCAKHNCCNLYLTRDVDEYDNNEFAFEVEWSPNNEESIVVECLYSHLTGEAEFTLLSGEINKFDRTWEIVKELNLNEIDDGGTPIWWEVLKMEDGVLWMNNCDGYMVFVCNNGQLLQTYF